MKVIHRTDQVLMIEDRPWLLGALLIGMALIFAFAGMAALASGEVFGGQMIFLGGVGMSALTFAVSVQRVRLTLDRSTGTVTRTMRTVVGLTQSTYRLERLERAGVGVRTDTDVMTRRMELSFRDPPETLPFTVYHTGGGKPEEMAGAVNDWLRSWR